MKNILERLKDGEILVGDGAMGTMLMERGLQPGEPPELFDIERNEVLKEIANLYLDAGADIVQTNTFGASPMKLAMYSLDDKTEEINRNAVVAVRKAAKDRAYVSASCGPCGKILKPYGDVEVEDVSRSFKQQMDVLIRAGADIICIETMIDLNEAILALKAAKDISSSIPVMVTMTFDATPKGFYTAMGVNIEAAAKRLEAGGADVIGSNCGNGIENMVKIAREFKKCSDLPLIIQSNAGIPEMRDGKTFYRETPEFFANEAKDLVTTGVSIIGGCCGTTPAHIRALRTVVDSMK
jgi:5-methyltetrahydrofolate--homocysteine methyltransferase